VAFTNPVTVALDSAWTVSDEVALRPEPFGALAYHYGNRRLVFLRSDEVVTVIRSLGAHDSVADAFRSAGVEARRWPAFLKALDRLAESEVIRAR
jgi:putative mycofactocin binding protein MftB